MIGKRKRCCLVSAAGPCDGQSHPSKHQFILRSDSAEKACSSQLTQDNLNRLNAIMTSPTETPASTPSTATRSTSTTSLLKAKRKLALYSIYARRDKPMPDDLAELKAQILDTSRDRPPSPRARKISALWRKTRDLTEEDAIVRLADHMVLGEDDISSEGPNSILDCTKNRDFAKDSFPVQDVMGDTIGQQARRDAGPLSTPRPDVTYGYAQRSAFCDGAFTKAEEEALSIKPLCDIVNLCGSLRFPFLTVQWKSLLYGGNQEQARIQGSKDGVAAVHSLYRFLRETGTETPQPSDTAHLSLTVDSDIVYIYLHWRNEGDGLDNPQSWEMDEIFAAMLGQESQMVEFRRKIHNVLDFALGRRLRMLKKAIARFAQLKKTSATHEGCFSSTCRTKRRAAFVTPPPSQESELSPSLGRKRRRIDRTGSGPSLRPGGFS